MGRMTKTVQFSSGMCVSVEWLENYIRSLELQVNHPDVVVSAAMPLHVVLTVGPNTLDITGDITIFEQVAALARDWLNAVAPGTAEQSRIAALAARVKAADDAIRHATEADTPADN